MHVFTTNTDWINTFMMSFMNKAVDTWMVQDSMSPIENEIVINNAEQNLPDDLKAFEF